MKLQTKVYTPEADLLHPDRLFQKMWEDLGASRELGWRLMLRNLSAMYRRTILGYLWAFASPLLAAVTFLILRKSGVTPDDKLAVPYFIWVLCGAFLWQTFADSIAVPLRIVIQSKPMLTKINFPREALILAAAGEVVVNFLIRALFLAAALVWFRVLPSWEIVFLPIPLASLIGLGIMISIFCTPFALLYQDVEKAVPMILPFLMVLSGAVVPLRHEGLAGKIATWNPVSPLLNTCRDWILGQPASFLLPSLWITLVMILLLFCGWVLYRVSMPHVVARIGA